METKLYIVNASSGFSFGGSSPVCVFREEKDASFYVWKANKNSAGLYSRYYSYVEVPLESVLPSPSEWKKYVKEQNEKITKEIEVAEACAEKDTALITKLRAERDSLATPT